MKKLLYLVVSLFLLSGVRSSDLLPECEYWASNGTVSLGYRVTLFPSKYRKHVKTILCNRHPSIMWSLCLSSCTKYAKNMNLHCNEWAEAGECRNNPSYMQIYCPESCSFSVSWNQFLRNQVLLPPVNLQSNILEKLLQPCQIPLNLLNTADILYDRFYLYFSGGFDLLFSINNQNLPSEYYNIMGISELIMYIGKLYEMIYILRNDAHSRIEGKNLKLQLSEFQSKLFDISLAMSSLPTVDIGTNGSVSQLLYDFEQVLLPKWKKCLFHHYWKIHQMYENSSQSEENQSFSSMGSSILSINECFSFPEYLDISRLNFVYYPSECNKDNHYCIDSSASSNFGSSSAASSEYDDEYDNGDYNEYSDLLNDEINKKTSSVLLNDARSLSDGMVIPRLGLKINPLIPGNIANDLITAIAIGYRFIDLTALTELDSSLDNTVGNSLQSLFSNDVDETIVKREDITIMIKFSDISSLNSIANTNKERGSRYYHRLLESYIERRLSDLQLSYIDIFLLDTPPLDPQIGLFLWKGIYSLYKQGKIKSYGLMNYDSYSLSQLVSSSKIIPIVLYNKIDIYHYGTISSPVLSTSLQEIQELLLLTEQHHITLIGYSPFSGYPYLMKPLYDPIIAYVAHHHTVMSLNDNNNSSRRYSASTSLSNFGTDGRQPAIFPSYFPTNKQPLSAVSSVPHPPQLQDSKHGDDGDYEQEESHLYDISWETDTAGFSKTSFDKASVPSWKTQEELSKDIVVTPAQIILRYFLEQDMVMTVSSSSIEHLIENYSTINVLPLTQYERYLIETIQYIVGNIVFSS
jgi:diketogulonate reductase-like aldo/keto reductase